ncbi:alpha/beta hydrolase family protein [Nostoc sp. MG11]|uniref:alpha/beta hydrolase family protein n=1 Tax=Nostoc sp. MG11 TaxID=2721166 RepID=UPI0018676974|nr:alpha/beta hydrolase [Nostoc sp. MG11]
MSEEQITQVLTGIANGFRNQLRSPILLIPADENLEFEDVTFSSQDGVPLEAWFIPKEGSDRLIIVNHLKGFNRYGLPSHLEPWKSMFSASGNDFEVNFIPDYKILHDAGYNVLTYDLRNHGHSSAGNGGIGSSGRFESRDVIGSLIYAKTRRELSGMTIGLFSQCLGCNSTIFAMSRHPEHLKDVHVRCLVGVQPLSPRFFLERQLDLIGVPADRIEELDRYIKLITSFDLHQLAPIQAAKSVTLPTLVYQVYDDVMTKPIDVQTIFDNMPARDKELFWVQGTTQRWDGYTYFQREPKVALDWFEKYMY